MLTVSEDCEALGECLKLGARGYLLKKIDQDFLLRSIRAAYNGDSVISPQMMTKLSIVCRSRRKQLALVRHKGRIQPF